MFESSFQVLQQVDPKFFLPNPIEEKKESSLLEPERSEDQGGETSEDGEGEEEQKDFEGVPENSEEIHDYYAKLWAHRKVQKENEESEEEEKTNKRRGSRSRSRTRTSMAPKSAKVVTAATLTRAKLELIPDDACIVSLGKKNSGKSVFFTNLLIWKNFPRVIVMGKARDFSNWKDRLGRMFIFQTFSETNFQKLMDDQEQLQILNEKLAEEGKPQQDVRVMLILEDFSSDKTVMRSPALSNFFSNGRRLGIFFVMSAQYTKHMLPDIRTQFTFYFFFKAKSAESRKQYYDTVEGYFKNKEEFFALFDATTRDRRVLVINNEPRKEDRIEDFANHFKAKVYPPRKAGCFLYRMFSEMYFQAEERELDRDLAVMLEREALKIQEIQPVKVNVDSIVGDIIPTTEIQNLSSQKGVFEIQGSSCKKGIHLIGFSD